MFSSECIDQNSLLCVQDTAVLTTLSIHFSVCWSTKTTNQTNKQANKQTTDVHVVVVVVVVAAKVVLEPIVGEGEEVVVRLVVTRIVVVVHGFL